MATRRPPLAGHPVMCTCESPQVYTRPSGAKVCINDHCGAQIEPPVEKQERP